MKKELKIYTCHPRRTDEELVEAMCEMESNIKETNEPFIVAVSGYNNDPRELYEIPEAIALFKRMMNVGLLSCLKCDVKLAETGRLGAFGIWAIATGRVKSQTFYVTLEDYQEFFDWLRGTSNPTCEANVARRLERGTPPTLKQTIIERIPTAAQGD